MANPIYIFESSLDDFENVSKIDDTLTADVEEVSADYIANVDAVKTENIYEKYCSRIQVRIEQTPNAVYNLQKLHYDFFERLNNIFQIFDNKSFVLGDVTLYKQSTVAFCMVPYPFNIDKTTESIYDGYNYTKKLPFFINEDINIQFAIFFNMFRKVPFKKFHILIGKFINMVNSFAHDYNLYIPEIVFPSLGEYRDVKLNPKLNIPEIKLAHIYSKCVLDEPMNNMGEYRFEGQKKIYSDDADFKKYDIDKYYNIFANKAFRDGPEIAKKKYGVDLVPELQWFQRNIVVIPSTDRPVNAIVSVSMHSDISLYYDEFINCVYESILANIPVNIIMKKIPIIFVKCDFDVEGTLRFDIKPGVSASDMEDNMTNIIYLRKNLNSLKCDYNKEYVSRIILLDKDGNLPKIEGSSFNKRIMEKVVYPRMELLSMTQEELNEK